MQTYLTQTLSKINEQLSTANTERLLIAAQAAITERDQRSADRLRQAVFDLNASIAAARRTIRTALD